MGQQLSPQDNELYKRVDEVLHYIWDPIGVSGCPPARDEYHSYLPKVFSLLKSTTDGQEIADYLLGVERESMSFTPSTEMVKKAKRVAEILLEYRELIKSGGK